MEKIYTRQISFFGYEGQERIHNIKAVIVGVGGIGSHIATQLAYLGVGKITIIDNDLLDETNLNRLVGARRNDPLGMPKVDIIERNILEINPNTEVQKVQNSFISGQGFESIKNGTIVFGCVDNDGPRFVLNELCLAYELPLIDTATEILPKENEYGGRVISIIDNLGCLYCYDELDMDEVNKYLESPSAAKDRQAIYGVDKNILNNSGPSVISLNGIMASIAVTEFMLNTTCTRKINKYLKYIGTRGIVTKADNRTEDCYYCNSVRGKAKKSDIERYIKHGRCCE